MAAIATVSMAAGDISHQYERIEDMEKIQLQ